MIPSDSPSSAWSSSHSRTPSSTDHSHLSPPTPDSYLYSAPAILTLDDFTLQLDGQPDGRTPGDDMLTRNKNRWDYMRDRLESSPPFRPHNVPRILPPLQDGQRDDFPWEASLDPNRLADPSRCSLLIHEVSLLVGLTVDDDHPFPDDGCPPVPDAPQHAHDILPLTLTPTKSLTSRRHRNAGLPHAPNANIISPNINPDASPSLYNKERLVVGSRESETPTPRRKSADAGRPSPSSHRRQGRVFFLEPPHSNPPHRNAVDLEEMFSRPREPPPRPTPNPPANRCSSLDRLERSLLKLEAHAPRNHRKSQSEGPPSGHARVTRGLDRHPSLPSPRSLKRQQSTHEITRRTTSRPAHGHHFSSPPPPVPRLIPSRQYPPPRICPAVHLDTDLLEEEDLTPSSFMDMDIATEEAREKRRTSFRQMKNKEKMKSLVSVAKRASRAVIAWGKHLTGSTRPPVIAQETTIIQRAGV